MAGEKDGAVQERGGTAYGDGVAWFRGSMIGKGGFGSVYLATLRSPRSRYSYFPPLMAVKSAEVSASGSIQKEREALSNVKGCPDIIRCFGEETTVGHNGVMVYNLLLEYGSGGTLADRIKKSGGSGLPEFEVRAFARSVLRGLNHIHGVGYVHCDLKPENILLVHDSRSKGVPEFRAKIGDFGLAKRAKQSKKRKLEPYWCGTPMYLSPEAVMDNVQEPASDIWAFGCIVLEMLTGKPPWNEEKGLSVEEILGKIGEGRELPKIPDEISKEARDFLKGCFVRKSVFRLTAEMLLNHPFVEGLGGEEGVGELDEVEDLNEFESLLLVSETDDEFSHGLYGDEWGVVSEEDSLLSWSEEDAGDEEDEVVSSISEERETQGEDIKGTIGSSIDGGINQPDENSSRVSSQGPSESRQHYPISFSIPAAV